MASTLVTAPAVAPITLAETKAHLRITHGEEDTLLEELIKTATRFLAENDAICAIRQTWRYYVDDVSVIHKVHRFPVIGINVATVFDQEGNATTLAPGAVELDNRKRPAEFCFDGLANDALANNGAEVDFDIGFGDTAVDVPDTIKRALLVLVSHWYTLRVEVAPKDQPVSVPEQYSRLVAAFRVIGLGG
ncbi:MAG: phage head-tail connector protein [Pseudomonadota bacterium]